MTVFLLDTNVISETRRRRPHGAVIAWIDAHPDKSFNVAAVSIGEVQQGIEMTRDQDAARAMQLEEWLEEIARRWNVIAADADIYRVWARLLHRRSPDVAGDAMIAATAIVRNLTVVTRNVRDFEPLGVRLLNPFETPR